MGTPWTVRPLRADDRAAYLAMTEAFYGTDAVMHPIPASYAERSFDEMMAGNPMILGFLLEKDGAAMGYALLARTWSQEAGGEVLWIEELYLCPECRGMGGGTAFFAYLKAHHPAARYRLEVEPENEGAVRLYRREGFTDLPYGQMYLEAGPDGPEAHFDRREELF